MFRKRPLTIPRQLQITNLLNDWLNIIQDWVFPPTCLLCGDPGADRRDLCTACADSLPRNRPACPRCGLSLPFASREACGRCQKRPPAFAATYALFRYEEPVRSLIHGLKFGDRYATARLLGQLLGEALTELAEQPQCIVPVPLHADRYSERGYNQAIEIGRYVSRRLQIPLDLHSCTRSLATRPQAELPAEKRAGNLKNAFRVAQAPCAHVAILDDVVTTGATVNELAKALRKAGVQRVDVWALARA